MAVSISWGSEPAGVTWDPTIKQTSTYSHKNSVTGSYDWDVYMEFQLGKVDNHTYAIRAYITLGTRPGYNTTNSGTNPLGNQGGTPKVKVDNGEYESGTYAATGHRNTSETKIYWQERFSTQYATISGVDSDITITCGFTKASKTRTVSFSISKSGPDLYVKANGEWIQADDVYIKTGDKWVNMDGVYVKVGGTWEET